MAGLHPSVVLQNDLGNQFGGATIVAAITGNLKVATLPIGVLIEAGTAGLVKDCVVNCSHVYTVDKSRLGKRMGKFEPSVMAKIDRALTISVGLKNQ